MEGRMVLNSDHYPRAHLVQSIKAGTYPRYPESIAYEQAFGISFMGSKDRPPDGPDLAARKASFSNSFSIFVLMLFHLPEILEACSRLIPNKPINV